METQQYLEGSELDGPMNILCKSIPSFLNEVGAEVTAFSS